MVVDEESCRDAAKWLKKPYDSRQDFIPMIPVANLVNGTLEKIVI